MLFVGTWTKCLFLKTSEVACLHTNNFHAQTSKFPYGNLKAETESVRSFDVLLHFGTNINCEYPIFISHVIIMYAAFIIVDFFQALDQHCALCLLSMHVFIVAIKPF